MFRQLYNVMIKWSSHSKAHNILACVAFAESSFFPIPPDVMLIPMGLAKPNRALHYALIATIFSVLGGIFGYALGWLFSNSVQQIITHFGYYQTYSQVKDWFLLYGIWIVFLAGFSPIPYKIFTVTAGILSMAFFPFVLVSFLSRGARFFLVSTAIFYFGDKVAKSIQRHIEFLGWSFCLIALLAYLAYHFY